MKYNKLYIGLGIAAAAIVLFELVLFILTGAFGRSAFYCLWGDDPELKRERTDVSWPKRGDILDCKGRVIATDRPVWDVHLDCTMYNGPEDDWRSLATDLAKELEAILGKKTSAEYYSILMKGRDEQKKYLTICKSVGDSIITALMRAPLLNMGQFDGGAIFQQSSARTYPFGKLGRRTIGYHISNDRAIGIEAAYNHLLYGKPGKTTYVRKNKKGRYYWKEKSRVEAIDGLNVTTTLDMDLMAVVDAQLRAAIEGRTDVKSACAVLMEAKSGAVRAMTNLIAGEKGDTYEEYYNLAIGNEYEPGTIITELPAEILEQGLTDAKFDIEGLRDTHYLVDEKEKVNVFCTPLHVLRIFGGIANGGEMFNPYLVTPSTSNTLCSKAEADSLKAALNSRCLSTAIVAHPSINGSDRYRYPSGNREFATTWCGIFNTRGNKYALLCVAFSKPTKANAPQRDIPEKVAKGIKEKIQIYGK